MENLIYSSKENKCHDPQQTILFPSQLRGTLFLPMCFKATQRKNIGKVGIKPNERNSFPLLRFLGHRNRCTSKDFRAKKSFPSIYMRKISRNARIQERLLTNQMSGIRSPLSACETCSPKLWGRLRTYFLFEVYAEVSCTARILQSSLPKKSQISKIS